MTCGIYSITSPSGKCYIGSSADIENRWSRHRSDLKKDSHHAFKLQRASTKHGLKALIFNILEVCSIENLLPLEQMYLTRHKPKYNTTLSVDIASCEQSRKKMLATIRTPEHRAKVRVTAVKLKTHVRLHTETAHARRTAWKQQDEVREMYRRYALARDQGSWLRRPEVVLKTTAAKQTPEFRARATEQFRDTMLPVHRAGCSVSYESIAQAARATGIPPGNIRRSALKGCKAGGNNWYFSTVDIVLRTVEK
jgi:group I intron endonuclease